MNLCRSGGVSGEHLRFRGGGAEFGATRGHRPRRCLHPASPSSFQGAQEGEEAAGERSRRAQLRRAAGERTLAADDRGWSGRVQWVFWQPGRFCKANRSRWWRAEK